MIVVVVCLELRGSSRLLHVAIVLILTHLTMYVYSGETYVKLRIPLRALLQNALVHLAVLGGLWALCPGSHA